MWNWKRELAHSDINHIFFGVLFFFLSFSLLFVIDLKSYWVAGKESVDNTTFWRDCSDVSIINLSSLPFQETEAVISININGTLASLLTEKGYLVIKKHWIIIMAPSMFIPFIRKTWSRWEPTGERGSIKQGMKDEPLAEPNLCSDIMGQLIEISESAHWNQ